MKIPDTDPEAMLILLNIIHCRTPKVPKSLSLPLLTKLAVLTDYFQCHDALGLYPESWMQQLKSLCPANYVIDDELGVGGRHNFDVNNWILISWVFRDPGIFKSITRLVQRQSRGMDLFSSLPIPATIRDAIDESRITALSTVLEAVENRLQELEVQILCSFRCDALMLGSLMKHMKAQNIPRYRPDLDYKGFSIDDILTKLSKPLTPQCISDSYRRPRCASLLGDKVLKELEKIRGIPDGLDLAEFC